MLWALFTVLAATAQTLRNAMQRDLIARVGVVGATHVRFLFGFPFAVLLLLFMQGLTGEAMPPVPQHAWPPILGAALAQIIATALMLQAMRLKSFVVATAYTKTEPVLVALFGLLFLGERLSGFALGAIGIATFGVMLTAWPAKRSDGFSLDALAVGLISAAFFALAAIGFRAGIHALPEGGFAIRASTVLVFGLGVQALSLTLFLLATDRSALTAIVKSWRPSLLAGFMGALASQFWFLGFALISAAKVRTLALVEVLFARFISGAMFREKPSLRDSLGLALIVIGVAMLLNA
jgi:drug/metabolite transporter (DMT)-like permease